MEIEKFSWKSLPTPPHHPYAGENFIRIQRHPPREHLRFAPVSKNFSKRERARGRKKRYEKSPLIYDSSVSSSYTCVRTIAGQFNWRRKLNSIRPREGRGYVNNPSFSDNFYGVGCHSIFTVSIATRKYLFINA